MKNNPTFEAGVMVAYMANESLDRWVELRKDAVTKKAEANDLLELRLQTLKKLGIPTDPVKDRVNHITAMGIDAEATAESVRFASLLESASQLLETPGPTQEQIQKFTEDTGIGVVGVKGVQIIVP